MKAVKTFIKPFEAPQRSEKTKHSVLIQYNFLNAQDGKGEGILDSSLTQPPTALIRPTNLLGLKFVSTIFYQIFIFHQMMIVLQKL